MKNDKYRWLRKIATLIGLVATMNLMIPALAASAADRLGDLSSVLGELRKGGLVIYFRHGPTDQTGSSDEAADLMKCETQRNLSARRARAGNANRQGVSGTEDRGRYGYDEPPCCPEIRTTQSCGFTVVEI
jgi:hypothetical protein